jgi:hypothetical protein
MCAEGTAEGAAGGDARWAPASVVPLLTEYQSELFSHALTSRDVARHDPAGKPMEDQSRTHSRTLGTMSANHAAQSDTIALSPSTAVP